MRDWKTPLEQIDMAVMNLREAFKRADAAGMEKALNVIHDITIDLLDEVIAPQRKADAVP